MSELTPLREAVDTLAGRTPSPDFGGLKRRATRRGRRRAVMVAAATAAVIAGSALAVTGLGGSDQLSPIGEPTTPSPTTAQESAEPLPRTLPNLTAELYAIVAQVPDWANADVNDPAFADYDYAFNGPCSGDWGKGAQAGHDGGIGGLGAPGWYDDRAFGIGGYGFRSEAQASTRAARFVENLASCNKTAWRTQPIAQTGAVLASSPVAVVWIQQKGDGVEVLQVPTTDGPPPLGVQVEVAEWMVAYIMMQGEP